MTIRPLLLTLAVSAALALGACKDAGKPAAAPGAAADKPPLAMVNGQPVSNEEFVAFVQMQTGKKPEELPAEERKRALDILIGLQAAAQEAEKEGLAQDPETRGRLEFDRLNVLFTALAQKYLKDKKPSDEELKAAYDEKVAEMPKLEYHARHILVEKEEQAREVLAKLAKGAKFEDLAKQYSTDGSKTQGGDLGWQTPQKWVPEFGAAVAALKKGETTKEPVKSQFGYHIIRLDDTRPTAAAPAFDTVKERLIPAVQQQKIKDYVESLKKAAKVEMKAAT
jgi:peptidyl-prolyl cis-trans isomerase C